ncbi:hypothetical protein Taro_034438, partial [Colocasia esculenta]|nr:hypothetical protein [Colocasia esculenta]
MLAGVFASCGHGQPRRSSRLPPRFPCSVAALLPLILLLLDAALTCVAADDEGFDPLIRLPRGGDGGGDGDGGGRAWPPAVFSVDQFGAVGDGLHNDTEAFLLAWRTACSMPAPAVLKVPARKTYLVGPIDFPGPCVSNLTLSILGTIIAPDDPDVWRNLNPQKWLYFHGINYLNVRGGGTINGMGERWWTQSCKVNKTNVSLDLMYNHPCQHAPTAITFHRCKDLRIQNLMLLNSQQMHIAFTDSMRVKVSGLKVIAPEDSPNTDGIHISASVSVEIKNSDIKTGDDCISIVSNSSKVRVRNIVCGPGHGISLGKFNSSSSVSYVHVDHVIFFNSENGFRIKTWQGGTGFAHKMFFRNAVMINVLHPIIIDQYYCDSLLPCPNQTSSVKVDQVSFEGIRGTSGTQNAVTIACSDTLPCEKIFLRDIQLSLNSGEHAAAYCWNAYGSSYGFLDPPSCLEGHRDFSNRHR